MSSNRSGPLKASPSALSLMLNITSHGEGETPSSSWMEGRRIPGLTEAECVI